VLAGARQALEEIMRRWILVGILIFVAVVAGYSRVKRDREQAWTASYGQAYGAFTAHNYSQAETILLGMLPEAEKWWLHDRRLANTLRLLGTTYVWDHKYDEAVPFFDQSFQVLASFLPPTSPELASAKTYVAMTYRDQGREGEAERYYSESLAIFEKNPGFAGVEVAWDLDNLGYIRTTQGRYSEAESLQLRAIASYEACPTSLKSDLASSISHLAFVYQQQRRYPEAEQQYLKALPIQETAGSKDMLISTLTGLSSIYQSQHKDAEAKKILERARLIQDTAAASTDARTLNNRAALAVNAGNYAEAISLYQQAIAQVGKTFGPEHPSLVVPLVNLARIYRDEEQINLLDAEPLYQRALAICEKNLGPDHPDTGNILSDMALLYFYEHKFGEAERYARRALPVQERVHGPESLEVSTTLNRLGIAERDEGKLTQAEATLKRALSTREKLVPSSSPWIATSLENLASVYLVKGEQDQAAPLLQRAQAIRLQLQRQSVLASTTTR
jgi:tetratricopeptide (TPR) repeat protein